MFRWLAPLIIMCSACGPLSPPRPDGGNGGGGGFLFGGGTGGGTGGGSGGGAMGGGGGAVGGGGGATGGGGGVLAPLSWSSMTISGATSASYIVGISGTATDLWAVQDTGYIFHSTGGAFSLVTPIQYGAKDLYAAGGTVVIIQTRSLRTCTSNCTTETAFADFDLLAGPYNLFGEAVCGNGPNDITAIVSDTSNQAQVFHWDGNMWTRTNSNLGVRYPRDCWFDSTGALNVVGEDFVVHSESGASSNQPLTASPSLSIYYGGEGVGGTSWVVGPSSFISRRTGSTWTQLPQSNATTLFTVGGLSENEVYALGFWHSTAGNGFKWNGTSFTPMGANALPNTGSGSSIRTMLVTAPNELYIAGSNNTGPIILRGRR